MTDDEENEERDQAIAEIGNMIFHGWWPWPTHIPKQGGYEYSPWIDYDFKPMLYSKPACSMWLRIKWILRK